MGNNEIKKLIEDTENQDTLQALDSFAQGGEEDLSAFLSKLNLSKKRIEPDRMLTFKILDKIKEKNNKIDAVLPAGFSGFEKIKIQLNVAKILKFAVPIMAMAIIGLVILTNPFNKETSQVAELQDIGSDEQTITTQINSLNSFVSDEKSLSTMDSALAGTQSLPSITSGLTGFFDVNSINNESNAINGQNSDFSDLIAQESGVSNVYSDLSNF